MMQEWSITLRVLQRSQGAKEGTGEVGGAEPQRGMAEAPQHLPLLSSRAQGHRCRWLVTCCPTPLNEPSPSQGCQTPSSSV